METKLNLIKNLSGQENKSTIVLPNFPFCYLLFKTKNSAHTYEVTDISATGMQISLKNGHHDVNDSQLQGDLHWQGDQLTIEGKVRWKTESRLGLEFAHNSESHKKLNKFLSAEHLASKMRSVHHMDLSLEIPLKLKVWLRADGPCEIFVWQYDHGEISKIQFLLLDHYIEWVDGIGVKTGKLFSKRDLNTPLIQEDEFTFQMDENNVEERINLALELSALLAEKQKITAELLSFIHLKLRH